MEGLLIWGMILLPSAAWGYFCGCKINWRHSIMLAGSIPWLGLLSALLITEYLLPYRGGGASMWPIAQLFAGTIMVMVAIAFHNLARKRHR